MTANRSLDISSDGREVRGRELTAAGVELTLLPAAVCRAMGSSLTEAHLGELKQIFELFGAKTHEGPHLDAHHASACLCKVALAVQQSNVDLPFNLNEKVGRYMEQMSFVSVWSSRCAWWCAVKGSAVRRAVDFRICMT